MRWSGLFHSQNWAAIILSRPKWVRWAAKALFPTPGPPIIQNKREDRSDWIRHFSTFSDSHSRPTKPFESSWATRASEEIGLRYPARVSISPAKRRLSSLSTTLMISASFSSYHCFQVVSSLACCSFQSCISNHCIWLILEGDFTSVSLSVNMVWIFPPFTPMAMAISSRQTPGSRVECFERKDNTLLLLIIPSVISRRQLSPNFISFLSNHTS